MANEHSQIVPSMQPTSTVADFKFWCQKVLPLVYDDSLSYYEVLNKMVVYLNQVIDNINADTANVAELEDDFLLLQTYVNNFFDDIDQLVTYTERAEAAQTAAAASAISAASSASNSATSASNSAGSASSAATSALSALDAKDAAVAAKTAAETALASAQSAATNAANSATAASNSATVASGSATNAAASAASALQNFQLSDAARVAAQQAAEDAETAAETFTTDTTLSVSGKAADAKATGDAIDDVEDDVSELKTAISKQEYQVIDDIADTGYIKTNEATVDITSVTASVTWRHLVMPCKQDDYFVVTGRGGNSARCYCFIDNAGNNIFTAMSNELANHAIYTPIGATKVVFNFNANYSYSLVCGKTVYQSQKDNNDMLSTWFVATTGYEPINNIVYGAIPRINGTIAPHPQYYYYEDSCTAGEKYLIRSTGFPSASLELYTTAIFMDGDTVVSYRNNNISKEVITVPDGATTIRVSGKLGETDYCLKQIGDLSGFYSTYEAVEPNADIGG